MRRAAIAAALVALALPAAAAAADEAGAAARPGAIAFGFAPPLGRTLRYEIERLIARRDRTVGTRFVRDYRFERREGGYRLWIELQQVESDSAVPTSAMFDASARPLLHVRYAIDLSPAGVPVAIVDQRQLWSHILDGQLLIRAHFDADPTITPAGRHAVHDLLERFRSFDDAEQSAQLLAVAENLLAFAGRSLAPETQPYTASFPAPWGEQIPLDGAISVDMPAPDLATIEIETHGEARSAGSSDPLAIRETSSYRVAPSSGLVHSMQRQRRIGPPGLPGDETQIETTSFRLVGEWEWGAEPAIEAP